MAEHPAVSDLVHELGSRKVVSDPDQLPQYETDWLGRRFGHAACAVLPETHDEVGLAVAVCRKHHMPIIPQGGNTGLVGGGIPFGTGVVLSLRNLRSHMEVDSSGGGIVADAGWTVREAGEMLAAAGLALPFDLASRDSATLGGVVATNAGGLHVIRYGHVRRQLMGVQAVLPDGTTVDRLEGLRKDTAGYDLPSLLCGSEGTLGIITGVRLSAVVPDKATVTAVIGCRSIGELAEIIAQARLQHAVEISAAELMREEGVALACELFGTARPFPDHSPFLLLLELGTDDEDRGIAALAGILEQVVPDAPVAVATDRAAASSLWALRERHPEIVGRLGVPMKLDTAVPLSSYAKAMEGMEERIHAADAGAHVVLYGHAGDGSLHVNVAPSDPEHGSAIEEAVYRWIASFRGTISAEHGIGRDKREWLSLIRSSGEIGLFRRVKAAFDPDGILNPGVILPETPATGEDRLA